MKTRLAALLAALGTSAALAGVPDLEQIMADPDWIGNPPTEAYWSDDEQAVYYRQKRLDSTLLDTYRLPLAGGEPERLTLGDAATSSNRTRVYNPARTRVAWLANGDVFVRSLPAGAIRQLTRTTAAETALQWMAAGSRLAYLQDGHYLVHDLETGLTAQPADLRFSADPAASTAFDALQEQQLRNLSTLRREADQAREKADLRAAQARENPQAAPLPVYLGDDWVEVRRSLSPTGRHLLLVVRSASWESGRAGRMPNYVTAEGYTGVREVRTRVGRNVPAPHTLLLVDLEQGTVQTLDYAGLPGFNTDPLAALRRSALAWHVEQGAERSAVEAALQAPAQRPLEVKAIEWNAQGTVAALQLHSRDNKDRWLATLTPETGKLHNQHRLTDPAWINYDHNAFGWMPDGNTLWFLSEESGYSQLYRKALDSRRHRAITAGDFVVREPVLSPDAQWFYLVANRSHPGNYAVYRVPAAGGELQQLTSLDGVVAFQLAPSGEQLLLSRSFVNRHPDLYLQSTTPGAAPRQLTDTVSAAFKAVDWVVPQIVAVPSSHHDRPIYSNIYLPREHTAGERYPAVMFVHGAGYTQNAHRGWSYYFREYMFHSLLANEGFVVIDMDYRASKGYGRDWRTAIYRNMGRPELEDFKDGIEYLVANYGLERSRVGIYGGSYGGFMTFMALFLEPELFAAGAALRPVADWMHYEHEYTSNILNTPDIDPEAYQRSSPINYVQHLQKPLLIAAGMQDDNVFFQDAVLVVQRLIELKKENFEMAIYPLDPHGFVHPASWLDEYRRIHKLMHQELMPGK